MTTTNHALTGALIAILIKQPFLAIPLAYLSHFVCDAIPHFELQWEFGSKKMWFRVIGDSLIALGFAIFLISMGVNNPVLLAVCGFVAMSPDLAWLYYGIKGQHRDNLKYGIISRFHSKIQWYQKVPGIYVELVWAALMVTLILKLQ